MRCKNLRKRKLLRCFFFLFVFSVCFRTKNVVQRTKDTFRGLLCKMHTKASDKGVVGVGAKVRLVDLSDGATSPTSGG